MYVDRLPEAIVAYDKAIQAEPGHGPAHMKRCEACLSAKRVSEAAYSCKAVLMLDESDGAAWSTLGVALERQHRLNEVHHPALQIKMPAHTTHPGWHVDLESRVAAGAVVPPERDQAESGDDPTFNTSPPCFSRWLVNVTR